MKVDYLDSLVDLNAGSISRINLRIWPYPSINKIDDYIIYANKPFQYAKYCFVDFMNENDFEGWEVS